MIRSMIRFSWAMSLFGARQAAEMLSAVTGVKSPRRVTESFDAIADAAEKELGEGGLGETYRTVDRWQTDLIDAVFGAATPAVDFSRHMTSKTLLRGSLTTLRRSAGILADVLPVGDSGASGNAVLGNTAWHELRNKLEAFETFQYADVILDCQGLSTDQLVGQIENAEGSGPYLKLWLTEGLGFALTEAVWEREEPRELLRQQALTSLPADSLIPLHTGMGLSLARRVVPDLVEQSPAGIRQALARFEALCRSNARDGFALASYEALGLIARQLAPESMSVIDRELAREDETSRYRDAFWHGAGRGLYFVASQAWPGSSERAVHRIREEMPDGRPQLNALAGLAWALALVNFRQPEVVEAFVAADGFSEPEHRAMSQGIASAALLWRDAVGEESHYRAFEAWPGQTWQSRVADPIAEAEKVWDSWMQSSGPEELFRFRDGDGT